MTDLSEGIASALEIQKQFSAAGTSLIVLTDGDSETISLPSSVGVFQEVVFLGVGSTHRGTRVNDSLTNQNGSVLTRLSAEMNGQYIDVNETNPPRSLLPKLTAGVQLKTDSTELLRLLSTICLIISGVSWCIFPILLQHFGASPDISWSKTTSEIPVEMGMNHS